MRRYLPLVLLIVIAAAVIIWQTPRLRQRPAPPAAATKAGPLRPPAPSVEAATKFLTAWSQGDAAGVYGMLTAKMKKMVSQADYAKMIADRKFTDPQPVAHVETAQAAYVIMSAKAPAPPQGERPLAGYSLLLKKEEGQWRVSYPQEEEHLAGKYEDLRLSPGKSGGWTVTYQNEKGQVSTLSLTEM